MDFILSFSPYEQEALKRVRLVELDDVKVRFASAEDVIIHKVIAGRPRDLEDVRVMLIKNPSVDIAYIRWWLKQFTASLQEPYLGQFEQVLRESQR